MTEKKAESSSDREKGQLGLGDEYNKGNEAASKLLLLHAAVSAGLTNEEGKKLQKDEDLREVTGFGIPRTQWDIDNEEQVRKDREKVAKDVEKSKQNPIDPS